MDYVDMYKQKLVTAEEAVKVVKSGDWVDYGSFTGSSVVLDKALAARKDELWDVKIRGITRIGIPEVVKADPSTEHFLYNSWHFSGSERKLHDESLCYYGPILYHELPSYYRRYCQVDVAMIPVSAMDEHGYFNFGPQASHNRAICDKAKIIILEVNPNIPRCLGGNEEVIHVSQVDYLVEANWPVPSVPPAKPTDVDKAIASLVINELVDGSCLQLGIGGLPNAVGEIIAQSDLKDIGIHSEMFVESMIDMVESGVLTGAKKQINRYKIVYTFSMGTQRTYDYLHNNPRCSIYPVNKVNDPYIIALNNNVMAINNCVEVDLTGQVCSESSGTRQISGTGGQVDFAQGAYMSKGGKAFLCMSSTYWNGEKMVSRVEPTLTPGAVSTTPRTMVSYLVTEYGLVNLKGKSTWERAEDIISIAHPDFREELIKEAEKMGIWRLSNKR
jgi:butyryl-CoA:acetate CoA-transferase